MSDRENFEGYHFTPSSKQQLMEGLAVAIQQRKIRYPEGVLTAQLESFEYEYTRTGVRYTAPSGMHDDCVCALALAVQHWTAQSRVMPPPYAWARDDPEIVARVKARQAARGEVFTGDGTAIEREQAAAAAAAKPRETDEERMRRRVAEYKASQGLVDEVPYTQRVPGEQFDWKPRRWD